MCEEGAKNKRSLDVLYYGEQLFPVLVTDISCSRDEMPVITAIMAPGGKKYDRLFIKDVIFNEPATIVLWVDGTKTVVKCQPGDTYSKELGFAMCIVKKLYGNKGHFNDLFKQWVWREETN